jgi:hypothetical protein
VATEGKLSDLGAVNRRVKAGLGCAGGTDRGAARRRWRPSPSEQAVVAEPGSLPSRPLVMAGWRLGPRPRCLLHFTATRPRPTGDAVEMGLIGICDRLSRG